MRNKVIIGSILVLMAVIGFWYYSRPLSLQVTTVKQGSAALFVYASGQVVVDEKINIRSKNAGRIEEILVSEGDKVKEGQVLVRLDSTEKTAEVALMEAELRQVEEEYAFMSQERQRKKALLQQNVISQREYDSVESQWRQIYSRLQRAQATVVAYKARQGDYLLHSPFQGVVLEKLLDAGGVVPANEPILSIGKSQKMQIEGKADELDAGKIALGQKVLISFDSYAGKVYEGKINEIAPKVDYVTKSIKIKVDVISPVDMKPGMSTELNILISEKKDVLLVPITAIQDNNVWMINTDSKLELRPVKTGIKDSKQVEIVDGLNNGDIIVQEYSQQFRSGMKVNAKK